MTTINWTAGTGAKIAVSVEVGYELDQQGRRKTSGQQTVILTATVDGNNHLCFQGLKPIKHPVAVSMLGDIGLIQSNHDAVMAAIDAAKQAIAAHNLDCDAHEARLNAIDLQSEALTKSMSCGEI